MISLPRLKDMLRVTIDTDDVLLSMLLDQAVAIAGTIANRHFGEARERTEYQSGHGSTMLPLRSMPTAATITVTEQKAPGNDATVLDAADFALRTGPRSAWLVRTGTPVWRDGYEYVVEYEEGYVPDELPGDVEAVIVAAIGRRYRHIEDSGLKSETMGQRSYTRFSDGDFLPQEMDTLLSWRQPVHA